MVPPSANKSALGPSTVLFAGPTLPQRQIVWQRLRNSGVRPAEAQRTEEVSRLLQDRKDISVVVCASELDGANWRTMLDACRQCPSKPTFVLVCERDCRPSLWAEVMLSGAFAVCPSDAPVDQFEQVVTAAHRHWRRQQEIERARSENVRALRAG